MRQWLSIVIILFCSNCLLSQEGQDDPKVELGGYIKYLKSYSFLDQLDGHIEDNLIHNRLNFKWYTSDNLTFTVEMRNRVFWGDTYQMNPIFEIGLNDGATDYLNLAFTPFAGEELLIHSAFDRIYFEYHKDKWNIRVGRQRINWGINLLWNPNDVFNAYNFVDFDYEERPGSDALRVQYNYDYASGLELVFNPNDVHGHSFVALWKTNKWNYDFQFLLGEVERAFVIGGGWAGNINTWGFKGEWILANDNSNDQNSFLVSTGFDYAFENGTYTSFGYLFNNIKQSGQFTDLFATEISYRNLFPYPHTIFNQWSFQITPLMTAGCSFIYAPGGDNLVFLNPSITQSITQDIDFDFIGQIVFLENQLEGKYKSPIQSLYFRLKWSF